MLGAIMNLITILVVLFITLYVVVKLAERYGKPMTNEQQQRYSKWIVILVAIMLLASVIRFFTQGG